MEKGGDQYSTFRGLQLLCVFNETGIGTGSRTASRSLLRAGQNIYGHVPCATVSFLCGNWTCFAWYFWLVITHLRIHVYTCAHAHTYTHTLTHTHTTQHKHTHTHTQTHTHTHTHHTHAHAHAHTHTHTHTHTQRRERKRRLKWACIPCFLSWLHNWHWLALYIYNRETGCGYVDKRTEKPAMHIVMHIDSTY